MANARNSDPPTSRLAAIEAEISGRAQRQRTQCLQAVHESPGMTAAELADRIGLERHAPSRRLPELRTTGQIRNGEIRLCAMTGRMSLTWYPVVEQST